MNHFGSTFILCFLGLTIFVRLNVEASGGLEGHLMMKMKKINENLCALPAPASQVIVLLLRCRRIQAPELPA